MGKGDEEVGRKITANEIHEYCWGYPMTKEDPQYKEWRDVLFEQEGAIYESYLYEDYDPRRYRFRP